MNDKDDDKQGLLDFLTDNLFGRERDAVTRAFYEYAEGDSLLELIAKVLEVNSGIC